MAKVRFLPSGITIDGYPGQTIFELGWKEGAGLSSACVGKGTCGLCRIKIISGEAGLSPYTPVEDKHLGNLYHLTKLRLSCQSVIVPGAEEIVIEVRQKKQRERP